MTGRRRALRWVPAGAAALLLVASSAQAAVTVTITTPGEDEVVQPGADSAVAVGGVASFDEPQAGSAFRYWLRRSQCNSANDRRYLSTQAGTDDDSGCGYFFDSPLSNSRSAAFTSTVPLEMLPLEAGRKIIGRVVLANPRRVCWSGGAICDPEVPTPGGVGVGQATTTVSVQVLRADPKASWETVVSTSSTYVVRPDQGEYPVNLDMAVPAMFNRVEPRLVRVVVAWAGPVLFHGALILNGASFVDIPTYSASFRTSVEVAVDGGAFSGEGVQVAADGAWSAALFGLHPGAHVVEARALQGHSISDIATRRFFVE